MKKMYWPSAIRAALRRGRFTKHDRELAWEWPTCAIGEMDGRVRRQSKDGPPVDVRLLVLGYDFGDAVADASEPHAGIDKVRKAAEIRKSMLSRLRQLARGGEG